MDDPLAVRDKAIAEALAVYDKALAEIQADKDFNQGFSKAAWVVHPVKMARLWFKGDLDSYHQEAESCYQKARDEAWAVYQKTSAKAWDVYEKNKGK